MAAGVAGRPGPWPARHTLGTTLRDKQGQAEIAAEGRQPKAATRRGRAVESIARSAPPGGGAAPLPEAACAAANGGIGRPERFQRRLRRPLHLEGDAPLDVTFHLESN
jgi:hypothetical protein